MGAPTRCAGLDLPPHARLDSMLPGRSGASAGFARVGKRRATESNSAGPVAVARSASAAGADHAARSATTMSSPAQRIGAPVAQPRTSP